MTEDLERQLALHRLRATMGLYGVGVNEVARRIHRDKAHVSRILSGERHAAPALLARIALAIHGLDTATETNQRPRVAA